MGRKRTSHAELPRRVYVDTHGHYRLFPRGGKPITLARGWDFGLAMAEYGRLIKRPTGPLATLGAVFDRYQREEIPKKAPRTQVDNLKELAKLRAYFGQMHPEDLEPTHVYQYMEDRGAPVRANREKALLSHACTCAIRWGVKFQHGVNPCKGVVRNTEVARDRCPSPEELEAFKQHAGLEMLQRYVDFKYMTSMRKGDILRIRLDKCRTDGPGIQYEESKKQKRRQVKRGGKVVTETVVRKRTVRWTLELRELVGQIKALPRKVGVATTYLFARFDGKPYTVSGFDSIWQRAMVKAAQAGMERFHEHDIRAASATADPSTAAERLGDTEQQAASYIRSRGPESYDPIPLKKVGT